MKKIYMLFCAVIAAEAGMAQPTFTAANFNPVAGQTMQYYQFDTTSMNVTLTGPGVTWNFASLTGISVSPASTSVVTTAATPYAASYPAANLAYTDAAGSVYNYYQFNATGQYQYGEASSTQMIAQSDPGTLYTFPFTYLFTSGDSLHATFTTGGMPATRKGKITTQADGYGTLVLPSGTYTNVLRVKQTWIYLETIHYGGGLTMSTTFQLTYFNWIKPNTHFPLLSFLRTKIINDFTSVSTSAASFLDPALVGISETELSDSRLAIFPNPATAHNVQLGWDSKDATPVTVLVTNAAGQLMHTNTYHAAAGYNTFLLNTKGLEAGVYIVQLHTADGSVSKKLVLH